MGPYRVPARATIAHMNANPSPLSSLTSSSGGVMPQGEEVASFATYPEAQRAVDALSDQGFPVQHLAIIGTDLRQVERITGRMSWGRAAMSGAMNGLWIGMFFGIIMSVAGSSGPRPGQPLARGRGAAALPGAPSGPGGGPRAHRLRLAPRRAAPLRGAAAAARQQHPRPDLRHPCRHHLRRPGRLQRLRGLRPVPAFPATGGSEGSGGLGVVAGDR